MAKFFFRNYTPYKHEYSKGDPITIEFNGQDIKTTVIMTQTIHYPRQLQYQRVYLDIDWGIKRE